MVRTSGATEEHMAPTFVSQRGLERLACSGMGKQIINGSLSKLS